MIVESLQGAVYSKPLAARHPASQFRCDLCGELASVWDHCHEHGIVRGPLCSRCNRWMLDVDNGLIHRLRGVLGESFDNFQKELFSHRARCLECPPEPPPVAPWVPDARKRTALAVQLMDAGWDSGCAWCPILQAAHGVPVSSYRLTEVRRAVQRQQRET